MSNARERLGSGKLREALDSLKQEVRKSPRDAGLRTFLFQMFCITGEWERALTQLTVAAELNPLAMPMAEAYRTLIRCELVRERVFAGTTAPTLFGQPLPWAPLLVEANRLVSGGHLEAAVSLRDEAFTLAEAVSGTADGQPFEWIADADPRLGPVLEAVIQGSYYWVPFQYLRELRIEPPADLRDQVWLPASFTWTNGGSTIGFIPARYPGSATASDELLALGRRTEWIEAGEAQDSWAFGLGQRMLATDDAELALLDLRHLALGPVAAAPSPAAS